MFKKPHKTSKIFNNIWMFDRNDKIYCTSLTCTFSGQVVETIHFKKSTSARTFSIEHEAIFESWPLGYKCFVSVLSSNITGK